MKKTFMTLVAFAVLAGWGSKALAQDSFRHGRLRYLEQTQWRSRARTQPARWCC